MLDAILSTCEARFRAQGLSWPNKYLVFDTETTGLSTERDLIGQIAFLWVENGKQVRKLQAYLDWTRHRSVDPLWLAEKLDRTRLQFEYDSDGRPNGKRYAISFSKLRDQGRDPDQVLRDALHFISHWTAKGGFFIAHNGWNFDRPILRSHFQRFLNTDYEWGDTMFDTGITEKAIQMGETIRPDESLQQFAHRIGHRPSGIKWSLDKHCMPKYRLAERHQLNMDFAHEAGFDCHCTSLLFEHYLESWRAKNPDQQRPASVSTPTGSWSQGGQAVPGPGPRYDDGLCV